MQEKVALEKSRNARYVIIYYQMPSGEHQRLSMEYFFETSLSYAEYSQLLGLQLLSRPTLWVHFNTCPLPLCSLFQQRIKEFRFVVQPLVARELWYAVPKNSTVVIEVLAFSGLDCVEFLTIRDQSLWYQFCAGKSTWLAGIVESGEDYLTEFQHLFLWNFY